MLTRSMLAGLPKIVGEIRPFSRFLKRNLWSCVRLPQRRLMTFATPLLGLLCSGKTMAPKRKRGEKAESEPAGSEASEKAPKKAKPAPKNKTQTDLSTIDFSCDAVSKESKPWNFKITSWNVNGLRAIVEKNGFEFFKHENPDVICLQETKCPKEKIPDGVAPDGYTEYWLSGDTEGYSGVGLISKTKPLSVTYGIGDEEHDQEGRVITAEYQDFYVVSAYVPNAGKKLVRLKYRMQWDKAFREYLLKKEEKKPVILCGDLNVAHQEIDLANPKTNKKNAGFTQEERDGFSELLKVGYVDSFRELHPDETGAYTFWTYMLNARAKNVGWRLDYFVISEKLAPNLCESVIRKDVLGSDHCPITLFMST